MRYNDSLGGEDQLPGEMLTATKILNIQENKFTPEQEAERES